MIITNESMDEILKNLEKFKKNELLNIKFKNLKDLIYPNFVQVDDCVIISKEKKEDLEKGLLGAIEFVEDKVYYEYSYNEIVINNFFQGKISKNALISIGLTVLQSWGTILKKIEPKSKFWMILACDKKTVLIRFHKLRDGEKLIIEKVNKVEQPVYCKLIG